MLQLIADSITYRILGFDASSRIGAAVDFFFYDSIKILLLLFMMIFVIGFLRTFLPEHKIRAWLAGKNIAANCSAALFGAVTPFCSCSSIPLFISFLKAGIPLGVSFTFLIVSPLINEYLVVLMLGYFGWKITVLYVLSGFLIGIITGQVLGRLGLEKYLAEDFISGNLRGEGQVRSWSIRERVLCGWREASSIIRKLWGWILVGVGVGALIHNFVPQESIQPVIAKSGIFSVPIAVLLGVPMYGSCAAIVPIAVALFQKGIPLGTALAFMMAISALSLPEAIMLRRAMRLQLIIIFFGITAVAIVLTGYLFNFIQNIFV